MKHRYSKAVIYCLIGLLIHMPAATGASALAQSGAAGTKNVPPRPANLDFEEGVPGSVPEGWFSPTKMFGYEAELTEENPKSGKRAAVLRGGPGATASGREFGNLMQSFDGTLYRGKRVRFKAAVKIDPAEPITRAQLWIRVDRSDNKMGFFNNMDDRPITSRGGWQYYEIIGDIDENAASISIGMLLVGKGKAWLDEVTFEELGKPIVLAEPARPLAGRGLENLLAFTRLLGYVRHFHPSDEAAAADWNEFAVNGVRAVESAKTAAELAQMLESLFRPVAPALRAFPTAKPAPIPPELAPPDNEAGLKIVSWVHRGFGQKSGQMSPYHSGRVSKDAPGGKLPEKSPDPQKPFVAELGGGVSCMVPLALFADSKGTLPRAASAAPASKDAQMVKYSGNDRATRLADVALAWNVFQHFYPYFDVVKTDWQQSLKDALARAANDADEQAFIKTMRRLVADLHDGHGNVYAPGAGGGYTAPVIFGWVEGRLVITHVAEEGASGLRPGDIVEKVDGKPSAEALAEMESLISGATAQWRRYAALTELRIGAKDSEIKLEVRDRAGKTFAVTLKRNLDGQALSEPRPPKIHEIKPGVFYVDLDRIKDEEFYAAMPQLEKAGGIVFDLRGYPRVSPAIITHLIDQPVNSAFWIVPIITAPDQKGVEQDARARWTLTPKAPRLKAKIAFLIDGRAISYAESYMGIIEAYKLAEIVGEPTAGTNGNINPFTLPGNYRIIWTGMKVLKHDRSQHHAVGIQPTVPVSRTIRGVGEKRDEQLERAVEIVTR